MGEIDLANLAGRLIIYMVVLLLAISAHEAGHAWMSYKYGDDTAFMLGRVTLNPIKHTDPIGTLLIPIVGFIAAATAGVRLPLIGWGIPTPVNPRKWTNYRTANVMVSIAGIGANLILATIGFVIYKTLLETSVINPLNYRVGITGVGAMFLESMIFMNVSLAVFNLLPFPPLDGSKVLSTFLPASAEPIMNLLETYGFLILILLVYMGVIGIVIYPVYRFIEYLLFTPWF
jgi:Zn-dependent protease